MAHLTVLYSRSRNPATVLIRLAAWWGPWSHCGIVDGEHVIESRMLEGGVVRNPLKLALERASAHQFVDIECPDPGAGIEWARSTIGRPYDWTGLLAIPLRKRRWQDPGRWYCSEHVEAALVHAGRARFRDGLVGISPCQSFFVR